MFCEHLIDNLQNIDYPSSVVEKCGQILESGHRVAQIVKLRNFYLVSNLQLMIVQDEAVTALSILIGKFVWNSSIIYIYKEDNVINETQCNETQGFECRMLCRI